MRTVIETPAFQKQAGKVWSEDERHEFIEFISCNPDAGDVIPGGEGARKVRWQREGMGKRGGARIIYWNFVDEQVVLLAMVYAKSEQANVKVNGKGDVKESVSPWRIRWRLNETAQDSGH